MKLKIVLIVAFFASLLIPISAVRAYDWSGTSINSGYAVTTDWHGEEVPIGTSVTARAGTTNLDIVEVKFRWLRPGGMEAWPPIPVTAYTQELWNGQTVRVFINAQTPNELGDWGVQAVFYDSDGNGIGPTPGQPDKIAIRATSFNAVPEVPFGTIAVLIAMFGALGIFAIKKKRLVTIGTPT